MRAKHTYEYVKNYIESYGYKLLSENYINNSTKMNMECPNGHKLEMHFNNFLQGKRCAKCQGRKPYSYEEVKNFIEVESNSGCKLLSNKFENNNTELEILCSCEQNIFKVDFAHFLHNNKRQCNICGRKNQIKKRKFSIDKIKEKVSEFDLELLLPEEDINTQSYLFAKTIDGYIVRFLYQNLISQKCTPEVFHKNNIYTINNIKLWLQKHNKNFKLLSTEYVNARQDLIWECNICNETWENCWDGILSDRGCPYCCGRYPTQEYNLLVCNQEIASEWNYEKNGKRPEEYCPSSNKKVWWKCKECNNEWEATIGHRTLSSSSCPKCSSSKGEKFISNILFQNNIYSIPQHTFSDCKNINVLKFDFYLPDYNICIEYQGIQHYEPVEYFGGYNKFELQQKLDQIKRDYCNKNNIILLEIPYWDFDNIEEILYAYINPLN